MASPLCDSGSVCLFINFSQRPIALWLADAPLLPSVPITTLHFLVQGPIECPCDSDRATVFTTRGISITTRDRSLQKTGIDRENYPQATYLRLSHTELTCPLTYTCVAACLNARLRS